MTELKFEEKCKYCIENIDFDSPETIYYTCDIDNSKEITCEEDCKNCPKFSKR